MHTLLDLGSLKSENMFPLECTLKPLKIKCWVQKLGSKWAKGGINARGILYALYGHSNL